MGSVRLEKNQVQSCRNCGAPPLNLRGPVYYNRIKGKLPENHVESAAEPTAEKLSNALVNTAMGVLGEKIDLVDVVQFIAENVFQLSAAALGDVVELIKVLIDAHKGSLSKVAEEIRELSSELKKEHNKWKNAFVDLI